MFDIMNPFGDNAFLEEERKRALKRQEEDIKNKKLTARQKMQQRGGRGFITGDGVMDSSPFTDYSSLTVQKGIRGKMMTPTGYDGAMLPGMTNRSTQKKPSISPASYGKSMRDVDKFVSSAVKNLGDEYYRPNTLQYMRSITKGDTIAEMAPKIDPKEGYLLQGANYANPWFGGKNAKSVHPTKQLANITAQIPKSMLKEYEKNNPARSNPVMANNPMVPKTTAPTKQTVKPTGTGVDLSKILGALPPNNQYSKLIEEKNRLESQMAVSPAALKQRSRERSTVKHAQLKSGMSSDYMKEANKIRAMLGQAPIVINTNMVKMNGGYNKYRYSYSADPVAIVNDFYEKKSVVDWAKQNTDIKPYVPLDMDTKALVKEKNELIARGQKTSQRPDTSYDATRYWAELGPVTGQSSTKVQSGTHVIGATVTHQEGVILKNEADYKRFKEIQDTLNKTGDRGIYSYYDKIISDSAAKKANYTKYTKGFDEPDREELAKVTKELEKVDREADKYTRANATKMSLAAGPLPQAFLDSLAAKRKTVPILIKQDALRARKAELEQKVSDAKFSYASIPESDIGQIAEYHGKLTSGKQTLEKNLDVLEQGINALSLKTGKGAVSSKRAGMFDYKATSAELTTLMNKYNPLVSESEQKQNELKRLEFEIGHAEGKFLPKIRSMVATGFFGKQYKLGQPVDIDALTTEKQTEAAALRAKANELKAIRAKMGAPNGSRLRLSKIERLGREINDYEKKAAALESNLVWVKEHKVAIENPKPDRSALPEKKSLYSKYSSELSSLGTEKQSIMNAKSFLEGTSDVLKSNTGVVAAEFVNNKLVVKDSAAFASLLGGLSPKTIENTRDIYKPLSLITAQKATLQKSLSTLKPEDAQYMTVSMGIQNLDNAAKFITGTNTKLDVMVDGAQKTIAKRTQSGGIDVLDYGTFAKLGISPLSATSAKVSAEEQAARNNLAKLEDQVKKSEADLAYKRKNFTFRNPALVFGAMERSIKQHKDRLAAAKAEFAKKFETPAPVSLQYIEDLEKEITEKSRLQDELFGKVKELGREHVQGTTTATLEQVNQLRDNLTQMKKKQLLTPGEYRKEMNKLNAEDQRILAEKAKLEEAVEKGEYFPDLEVFDEDNISDADEIRGTTGKIRDEAKKDLRKAVLKQGGTQPYSGVTRGRIPAGSAVGSARSAVPRPPGTPDPMEQPTSLSSMTTTLGGTRNPFLDSRY